jgi:STE24 endopeptidase
VLLMSWTYPTLIAPLFNRFTPLRDAALEQRIQALFGRCGFHSDGIYVMDGSKRSGHGNAYFTGLGKSKRIVFFDTLLGSLGPNEIEAVLAHELGHFKRRHVFKQLLLMGTVSLAALAVLGWATAKPELFHGLGIATPSHHTGLILFLLLATVFGVFLRPLLNRFSRGYEFEADDFAARLTGSLALIHALVKLYRDNASTLRPPCG